MSALTLGSTICNLAIEGPDLPLVEFQSVYRARNRPVVIRNATQHSSSTFRLETTVDALRHSVGDALVTLSSANAYSYGRKQIRVADYFERALGPAAERAWADAATSDEAEAEMLASEMYYWFGEHGDEIASLLERYPLPRFASRTATVTAQIAGISAAVDADIGRQPALSFGVGPHGSGVPFHFHNDGFSEVLHGSKRWFLYPSRPPYFSENATSVRWLYRDYPKLRRHQQPYECVIHPGDLLYFPNGWYHAIVNLGETVFMSTFL